MRARTSFATSAFWLTALLITTLLLIGGCGGGSSTSSDLSGGKEALAKGGNGGGKPGGDDPPADPAIVYQLDQWKIQVMNADGSNQNEVFSGDGLRSPSWSRNGEKIVFTSPASDRSIFTVNLDGSGLFELLAPGFKPTNPIWSPDPVPNRGEMIAFSGAPSSGYYEDLYLINPSGDSGTLENLTNTPDIFEAYATWSSDASRLAYVKMIPARLIDPEASGLLYELWIYDFTTSEATQVALGGLFFDTKVPLHNLDWARTQDKIAFAGFTSGFEIWVVDLADPANPVQLTDDPDDVHFKFPSWSPDDSEIVFNKGYTSGMIVGYSGEIWKMNADGTGKTLLADAKGRKTFVYPDWKR